MFGAAAGSDLARTIECRVSQLPGQIRVQALHDKGHVGYHCNLGLRSADAELRPLRVRNWVSRVPPLLHNGSLLVPSVHKTLSPPDKFFIDGPCERRAQGLSAHSQSETVEESLDS